MILDFIKSRRSIRRWSDEKITDEEIEQIIDAARFAPSGSNAQPWFFVVVRDQEKIQQLAKICEQKVLFIEEHLKNRPHFKEMAFYLKNFYFFQNAPLLTLFCLKKREIPFLKLFPSKEAVDASEGTIEQDLKDRFWGLQNTDLISVSMAMQNFTLMAHALGIGTCIMTGPLLAEKEICSFIEIHPSYKLLALTPMGKITEEDKLRTGGGESGAPKRKDIKKILKLIDP